MRLVKPPEAWVIKDVTSLTEEFEITSGIRGIQQSFSDPANQETPSTADATVLMAAQGMVEDPIAKEYYRTILETDINRQSKYSSLHLMFLGADELQEPHYHRANKGDGSARRYVIVYPLKNAENGNEGIEFSWFPIKDGRFVMSDDGSDSAPELEAEPAGKKHTLYVPPGLLAVIKLDQGVHCFKGTGLAISMHPEDIAKDQTGSNLNTLVGNTFLYRGDEPTETKEIELDRTDAPVITEASVDVFRKSFLSHSTIAASFVEKGATERNYSASLVKKLRQNGVSTIEMQQALEFAS